MTGRGGGALLLQLSAALGSGVYEEVKNRAGFVDLGPDRQEDTNPEKPFDFSRRVAEASAPSDEGPSRKRRGFRGFPLSRE